MRAKAVHMRAKAVHMRAKAVHMQAKAVRMRVKAAHMAVQAHSTPCTIAPGLATSGAWQQLPCTMRGMQHEVRITNGGCGQIPRTRLSVHP
jgi:siroheme synthase